MPTRSSCPGICRTCHSSISSTISALLRYKHELLCPVWLLWSRPGTGHTNSHTRELLDCKLFVRPIECGEQTIWTFLGHLGSELSLWSGWTLLQPRQLFEGDLSRRLDISWLVGWCPFRAPKKHNELLHEQFVHLVAWNPCLTCAALCFAFSAPDQRDLQPPVAT